MIAVWKNAEPSEFNTNIEEYELMFDLDMDPRASLLEFVEAAFVR